MKNNRHITGYLKGARKGADANRVEREAMQDPFLHEALAGYDKHSGDHAGTIHKLQQQVKSRSNQRRKPMIWWAAACIVALLGVGTLFFIQPSTHQSLQTESIAVMHEAAPEQQEGIESSSQATQIAEHKQEIAKFTPPVVAPDEEVVEEMVSQKELQTKIAGSQNIMGDDTEEIMVVQNESPVALATKKEELATALAVSTPVVLSRQAAGVQTSSEPANGNFLCPADTMTIKHTASSTSIETKIKDNSFIALNKTVTTTGEDVAAGYGARKLPIGSGAIVAAPSSTKTNDDNKNATDDDLEPLIETAPTPLMGKKLYQQYIAYNLQQPTDSLCATAKGNVTVTFKVNANGRPYDIKVTKSLCPSCDAEAIRLIENGGLWSTSRRKGKYTIKFPAGSAQ